MSELLPAAVAGAEIVAASPADALAAAWLLGYRGHTRAAYQRDLQCWARYLADVDVDALDAQRVHVDAYVRLLEQRALAPSTIARRLTTLTGFYAYCVDEDAIARTPVRGIKRPRVSDESPTLGLERPEASALLACAEAAGPRDHALAALLFLNGLRVSEAIGADVEDLDVIRGHRVLHITRKGGKHAAAALSPPAAHAVDVYLASRTDLPRPAGARAPLILGAGDDRLSRHAAARVIARLAKAAGVTKQISPHSLRHSYVTLALDAGVPLHHVQDGAGHADPRTTRRYDRARNRLDRDPTYALARHLAD